MSTPEERRHRAKVVEISTATPAGIIGSTIAAERARDQYKNESPDKAKAALAKVPRFARSVAAEGHVKAPTVMAGAVLGTAAYAGQRYEEQSLLRETRRQKAAAKARRVRDRVVTSKGAGMGTLQEIAKADRAKRNVGNAALVGSGALAYSARESHQAARGSSAAAGTARAGRARSGRRAAGGAFAAVDDLEGHIGAARTSKPNPAGGNPIKGWDRGKATTGAAKFLGDHQQVGEHIADAVRLHREVGAHEAAIARHTAAAHTKAGAAAGLLAVAAAAHASRKRPDSVQFY